MEWDRVRLLAEMSKDIRGRIPQSAADGTAKRYAALVGTLLAAMAADARVEPECEQRFLARLRAELAQANFAGMPREMAIRLEQLRLLAENGQGGAVTAALGALLADMLHEGGSAADLAARIMALEAERRDGIQAGWEAEFARSGDVSDDAAQGGLDAGELLEIRDFLRLSARAPDLRIEDCQVVVGGYSKQTLFLRLSASGDLPGDVVLRRDRAVTAIDTTVANEFALVDALHRAGIAVARPLALFSGGDGAFAYMVSERVQGISIGDPWSVTRPGEAVALSLAEQLARLHALPFASFGSGIDGAEVTTRAYMEQAVAGTERTWRDLRKVSPVIDAALAWVQANLADCEGARSLVHRDVGCHNMLVGPDGCVAALLDWETVWIGHRARDLSYVRAMVTQCIDWERFRAAYEAHGGVWPSERELRFYSVWGDVQAAVECVRSGHLFFSGQTDDISFGYSGIYNAERFLQRIARTLASGG